MKLMELVGNSGNGGVLYLIGEDDGTMTIAALRSSISFDLDLNDFEDICGQPEMLQKLVEFVVNAHEDLMGERIPELSPIIQATVNASINQLNALGVCEHLSTQNGETYVDDKYTLYLNHNELMKLFKQSQTVVGKLK